ncbi:hypothetical protein PAM_076 [Onion yellows phytoplasma OY-M]|uniref:Solute-binding protein family 3/N-terminal domain-containing protein n=1 Tax=Onion yellows phytoplasma (strain OY-M) TaxID=262768 RepID=Q6YRD9_ONYPE|nr:hypothetical protein PAM_076 [Onion yellows phytoplasma OY-M]
MAAACFSIMPERRDKMDFSVVYNVPMNALIVRKDNPDFLEFEAGSKVQDKDLFAHLEKLSDKAAEEGKTKKFNFIAMATNTTDKELFKQGNMKAQLSPKYRDNLINYATGSDNAAPNLQAVRENKERGKEVIYVIDDVIARGNVEGDKDLKYISLQTDNPLLLSSPEGIGIAVHKGDKEMLKAVNNALVKLFDLDVKKKEVEKEEDNGTKTFKVEDKIYDLKKILETLRKLKPRLAPQRTKDQETKFAELKGLNSEMIMKKNNLKFYSKFGLGFLLIIHYKKMHQNKDLKIYLMN